MVGVTVALLAVIASIIILAAMRWIVHRFDKHSVLKRYGIPGPPPNFFHGHFRELRKEATPFNLMDTWLKKYGDVCGFYLGEVPYIIVNDLEIIKQVFIKDFSVFTNRPDLYMNIHPVTSSIVGISDQKWKDVRAIISPTFSTAKLKLVKGIFDKKVNITVDVVRQKVEKNEMFDIYAIMQALTLDVIADTALAMKLRCQEDPNDKLLVSMKNIQETANSFALELGEIFPFIKPFFSFLVNNVSEISKVNSIILQNLNKVIDERRKNPNLRSVDILQLMLDSSDQGTDEHTKLSDEDVLSNSYITLIAGYETTSTALGYAFYLLVKHPEIQERLYEEISNAPDSDYSTLQGLRYLRAFLDETLRLYPPVTAFVSRVCKKDYKIKGYTFPKDSVVWIPIWQLHHNPEYFPEPFKFDPERFSVENKSSIRSMSYLPFGEGPRNCVGARFALLEARLAIFKLLKNFKFVRSERFEDDLPLVSPALGTNPATGIWVQAIPRENVNKI